jgi:6-phosphogluconolactonase
VTSAKNFPSAFNGLSTAALPGRRKLTWNRRESLRLLLALGTTVITGRWAESKERFYSKSKEGKMLTPSVLSKNHFVYVGCRTTKERNARGKGISVYTMDGASGGWSQIQLLEGLTNPSFLTLDRAQRFLYCVHGDRDEVSAFSIDPDSGKLAFVNHQNTGGTNPVYLTIDPSGRIILIANYGTGSIAVLPINEDGSMGTLRHRIQLQGTPGPHRLEQTSSHPHQAVFSPDGKFVVVPDKGLDRIFVIALNAAEGTLEINEANTIVTRSMAGPRHVAFHPLLNILYAINELDSTITSYSFDPRLGRLHPLEWVSTVPAVFTSTNTASGIAVHPSGRYLYCSNRGHDSIAAFAISADGASLSPLGWQLSQGKQPRFFSPDPSWGFLYAANELSDTIAPFRIEPDGRLHSLGHVIETGSPTCIVFKDR